MKADWILPWIQRQWCLFDEKAWLPFLTWRSKRLRKKIEARIRKYHLIYDWKEKVFEDFSAWLAELPEDSLSTGNPSETPVSCDLFTLLSEFITLKQEIRLQNREQDKTLAALSSFTEVYQQTAELFRNRTQSIAQLEENIRRSSEKRVLKPFMDVRDALVRGRQASISITAIRSFFRPPPKGIESITEGYEMALRRLDGVLANADIRVIESLGKPFDPKTMKAVDKRPEAGVEKGVVVEELLTGFVCGNEILRTAEVIVAD